MDDENSHDEHPKDDSPMGNNGGGGDEAGSTVLRPVFLGNLSNSYTSADMRELFERPINPPGSDFKPIPVDRVDLKRGYCFVFLKDAVSQEAKQNAERFVSDINGMEVPNLSSALRAEFARGDGRVKRKEDDRRKRIQPSETLFVVNFHEQTTKRDDLRMLFEPYGELVRIEMKRNYAFVQFQNIEHAIRARDEVNGGKLDQSVLTVEFVAQQRGEGDRRGGGSGRDRRGGDRRRDTRDRFDDYRRRSPPRDRYHDDRDSRRRSPPPRYRGGRSRSRSRSPPRYDRRSRSPRGRDYYDDRGGDRGRHDDHRGDRGDRWYRGSDRGDRGSDRP